MSGNSEKPDDNEPTQGPETVVPFVPKSERVRPIVPRWETNAAPPTGPEPAPAEEDGDDPGPSAA